MVELTAYPPNKISAIISDNKRVAAKSIRHMPLQPINSGVGLPAAMGMSTFINDKEILLLSIIVGFLIVL